MAEIIFEDEAILVVDKNPNVVVNRSGTITDLTLQDDLSKYFKLERDDLGIGERAGIVHRLDRETSGLLVVAKTQEAFENLQVQFKERKVKKEYVALVHGKISDSGGEITAAIGRVGSFGKFGVVSGGRDSKTEYAVDGRFKISDNEFNGFLYSSSESDVSSDESRSNKVESSRLRSNSNLTRSRINYFRNHARDYTLLSVFPKTGRTHQIRVHLKSIGYPLVSDLIYTPSKLLKFDLLWCKRLFLHAKSLEFTNPETGKRIFFESDLPEDLKQALGHLTLLR